MTQSLRISWKAYYAIGSRDKGVAAVTNVLSEKVHSFRTAMIFDFTPVVGTPESDGLAPDLLMSVIDVICDKLVVDLDLVEVAPHYDSGVTAVAAARTLFESISSIEASRLKLT